MKKSAGRTTPIDRLNQLPEALLIYILSFLTTKEAAVTSLLSKRWRFLWTELPKLELWESENQNEDPGAAHRFVDVSRTRRFMAWVDRIFGVRSTASVDNLSVRMQYHRTFDPQIDDWIRYAISKRVKAMTLLIHSRHEKESYTFPDSIYSIPSLERLLVQGSISMSTQVKVKVNWGCLKELYLETVNLNQDMVDGILAGCPVLGRLELKWCSGFRELKVESENLHTLAVDVDEDSPLPLRISAPHLHFLDVSYEPDGRLLEFQNFGTLPKFRVDYSLDEFYPYQTIVDHTFQLWNAILDVKELHLKPNFTEVISRLIFMGWVLPQSQRTRLEVYTSIAYVYNFFGIKALLQSSREVETLVIEGFHTDENYTIPHAVVDDGLNCDLPHLKNVYFKNFSSPNGEPMLTWARILLRRALGLKKMEFAIDGIESKDVFNKIYKKLLRLPRANAIYADSHQYQSIRYKATVIFRSVI